MAGTKKITVFGNCHTNNVTIADHKLRDGSEIQISFYREYCCINSAWVVWIWLSKDNTVYMSGHNHNLDPQLRISF
jgi:hypothetical protein